MTTKHKEVSRSATIAATLFIFSIGKELGIGLGTAVIGPIMFRMAIGSFADNVAKQMRMCLVKGYILAIGTASEFYESQ